MVGVFIPGWGASAALYNGLLPRGWEVIEPPSFRASKGALAFYRSWLRDELARRPGPIALGGHSFGAALAVLATSDEDAQVERLVLVAPAGLPLAKPLNRSLRDFFGQIHRGLYPLGETARLVCQTLVAPRSALRLAQSVRRLDLHGELTTLRRRSVPSLVLVADTDTLTTPTHCREIAKLLGGNYRELSASDGHMWFLASDTPLDVGA